MDSILQSITNHEVIRKRYTSLPLLFLLSLALGLDSYFELSHEYIPVAYWEPWIVARTLSLVILLFVLCGNIVVALIFDNGQVFSGLNMTQKALLNLSPKPVTEDDNQKVNFKHVHYYCPHVPSNHGMYEHSVSSPKRLDSHSSKLSDSHVTLVSQPSNVSHGVTCTALGRRRHLDMNDEYDDLGGSFKNPRVNSSVELTPKRKPQVTKDEGSKFLALFNDSFASCPVNSQVIDRCILKRRHEQVYEEGEEDEEAEISKKCHEADTDSSLLNFPLPTLRPPKELYQNCRPELVGDGDDLGKDASGASIFEKDGGDFLLRHGVSLNDQFRYARRFNAWLIETLVFPISQQIDSLNRAIHADVSPASQSSTPALGKSTASTLRTFAQQNEKKSWSYGVGVICKLLLSAHPNQAHLVRRIRFMASTHCIPSLTLFEASNSACLPDAAILCHMLFAYFDTLIPQTSAANDQPFKTRYVTNELPKIKKAGSDDNASTDRIKIYQSSENPCFIGVIFNDRLICSTNHSLKNATKSNSAFPLNHHLVFGQVFVVFFYLLKQRFKSHLGPISLGPAGLNLLQVFA